jgi:adenosylcobinamide kinase/adenosylcobinamide-phosphate guanylyltransferase
MMILVTGGSKCGKSSFAEKILDNTGKNKYYLATMQPFGEDAREAIERHRIMRENKDFITIEKYMDIDEIQLPSGSVVLLECLGNLCANEMFVGEEIFDPADKIITGLKHLDSITEKLVIVTNEVGCDGIQYTKETMKYISAMAEINRRAAEIADTVVECIYGIPVVLKGEILC